MEPQLSSTLLRVIAETVDGYTSTEPLYVVADTKFPHEREVFASKEEAEHYISSAKASSDLKLFGPFAAKSATQSNTRITSIKVTYEVDGQSFEADIDPSEYDLLAWSESALEKFVYPYYARVYGLDYAIGMKNRPVELLAGHIRKTTWIPQAIIVKR